VASVIENIVKTCDGLGDIELSGVKLESAERDLLDVSWGDLDQHVAMQPAAMAYFGALKKEAKRRCDNLKAAYDRWEKKKYAEARVAVESGTTAKSSIKVEDVKARFIIDNEPEIEKWEKRLDKARAEYDTLDTWLEAWKQKSFSLNEYISIDTDERRSGSGSVMEKQQRRREGGVADKEGLPESKHKRVKELIQRGKERQGKA